MLIRKPFTFEAAHVLPYHPGKCARPENVAIWNWRRLVPEFPPLAQLVTWETATACAIMRRGDPLARPLNPEG